MNNLSLTSAIELLKKKEISSYDLVKFYSGKITRYNKSLNVYLTLNDEIVEASRKIKEIPSSKKPLMGIPIAIKDIFLTKGLRTTASSKLLDGYIPQYSATVVKRLEEAGALILGKTNLDAWCHGSSTET